MVSHSSHTNHEFLILVIRVTNVTFAMFGHLRKSADNVTYKENFPIWRIYYKLSYEKFCKEHVKQM